MEFLLSVEYFAEKDIVASLNKLNLYKTQDSFAYHLDVMRKGCTARDNVTDEQYKLVIEHADFPIDAHLMIPNPIGDIKKYLSPKLRSLTFQLEMVKDTNKSIQLLNTIKKSKVEAGICIDVPTAVTDEIASVIKHCDTVTIMGINIGRSGEPLSEHAIAKIEAIKKIKPDVRIIWDGGIRLENLHLFKGVDNGVIASAVFKKEDPIAALNELQSHARRIFS